MVRHEYLKTINTIKTMFSTPTREKSRKELNSIGVGIIILIVLIVLGGMVVRDALIVREADRELSDAILARVHAGQGERRSVVSDYNAVGAAALLHRPALWVRSPSQVILGIDPGPRNCGWGLIRQEGSVLTHLGHGAIVTSLALPREKRLAEIWYALATVGGDQRVLPDAVAIEDIAWGRNVASALDVARVCGMIECEAAMQSRTVTYYTPQQVKQAVSSVGSASKSQVAYMVRVLLNLTEEPKPDHAADALAVAITHAMRGPDHGKR